MLQTIGNTRGYVVVTLSNVVSEFFIRHVLMLIILVRSEDLRNRLSFFTNEENPTPLKID